MVLEGAEGWISCAEEDSGGVLVVVQSPGVGSTQAWWVHPWEVVVPFSLGSGLLSACENLTPTSGFCWVVEFFSHHNSLEARNIHLSVFAVPHSRACLKWVSNCLYLSLTFTKRCSRVILPESHPRKPKAGFVLLLICVPVQQLCHSGLICLVAMEKSHSCSHCLVCRASGALH